MKELIKQEFSKYGIALSAGQCEMFEKYYKFLIEENQKFNLTAITEEKDVITKHFIDSVLPYQTLPKNASVIDVGSGAGLPGLPLKILRPDLKIVLLDSLQKRVNFLAECIQLLGIKDAISVHARVEDYCQDNREKFDVAVSRAVAQVNTLSEYLLPLVKVGGRAIMYKSQRLDDELEVGRKAIKILGGEIERIDEFSLDGQERKILLIKKVTPSPKAYPRGKNLPKVKPII